MPTEPDLALVQARTAWWLLVCRLTDPRKPTLADVATAAGLSEGSGSTISRWENNQAVNPPKLPQLRRLAAFYGVPLSLFTEPPETDEERAARYRQLALGAVELAQQDLAVELGVGRVPGESLGDAPRRRSA
jgi:transcriptional regulator with XRE-family HTH domain